MAVSIPDASEYCQTCLPETARPRQIIELDRLLQFSIIKSPGRRYEIHDKCNLTHVLVFDILRQSIKKEKENYGEPKNSY
jgi:hypothetical protein